MLRKSGSNRLPVSGVQLAPASTVSNTWMRSITNAWLKSSGSMSISRTVPPPVATVATNGPARAVLTRTTLPAPHVQRLGISHGTVGDGSSLGPATRAVDHVGVDPDDVVAAVDRFVDAVVGTDDQPVGHPWFTAIGVTNCRWGRIGARHQATVVSFTSRWRRPSHGVESHPGSACWSTEATRRRRSGCRRPRRRRPPSRHCDRPFRWW